MVAKHGGDVLRERSSRRSLCTKRRKKEIQEEAAARVRAVGLRDRMASITHDARVLTAILHEARGAALSSPSSATTGDGDVEINLLQA